jgi:hypothetical protein
MAVNEVPEEVAAVEQPLEQQNMLSQDQVNKIVAREKARAAESARRQMQEQMAQQQASVQEQQQQAPAQGQQVDPDELYRQVQERFNAEMQERQLKDQMTQVANNYLAKVEEGKKNYQDFDEVTKDFDPTAFPQLTYLLANMDNAGDVLYDLVKNPIKLAGIDRLAERAPRQAQAELMKLSVSIKENRQAQMDAQNQDVPQPLDAMKSSRVAGSNGKMGIRDLRNQDWLRG